MKPIAGLNRDVNPLDQPDGTMRYAANGIVSEKTGLVENVQIDLEWNNGTLPLGFRFLGNALGTSHIYMFGWNTITTPSGGRGEIWRIDPAVQGSEELVIIDPDNLLEFEEETGEAGGYDANKILQFVFQQDFELDEVFAWCGQIRPKIVDVGQILRRAGWVTTDPPVDLTAEGYTTTEFLLFPEGGMFNPNATAINSGGNVFSGAWMFVYRYIYNDLSSTNWSGVGNTVYITEDSFDKNFTFQGDEGNRPTTKSISIDIIIDPNQAAGIRIQFGFIAIRNRVTYAGILDAKSLADLPISGDVATYIYTGEAIIEDLGDNILELITKKALFTNAGTITSLTSRLYAGNLTTKEEINIQEIANDIVVGWSSSIPSDVKGGLLNQATFGAGEVYALYISILFDDGSESRAFHIPGRKTIAGDQDDIGTDPQIDAGTERWQLYDTTTHTGGGVGNCGYWINKGEDYPNLPEFASAIDTGTYANNIRHHKMPSIGFLYHEGAATITRNLPKLSFQFSNIILSSLDANAIGYNIHYAKRKYGEIINLAYDYPSPCGQQAVSDIYPIAGGFAYSDQDETVDPVDSIADVVPISKLMRFHALNLLTDLPSINPQYFVKEYRSLSHDLRAYLVDSDEYTPFGTATPTTLNNAYKYGYFRQDEIGGLAKETFDEINRYVKIIDYAYVKNGVNYAFDEGINIINKVGEDAFIVSNNSGFDGVAGTEVIYAAGAGLNRHNQNANHILTLAALRAIPGNISLPFDNQVLTFAKSFRRTNTSVLVNGKFGDTYNGMSQWTTTGVAGMGPDPLGGTTVIETTTDEAGIFKGEGSKIVNFGSIQCPINVVAQYAPASDVQSYVNPIQGSIGPINTNSLPYSTKTIANLRSWYFNAQNIYASLTFYYSDDFHERSEYFTGRISDGYIINVNTFPTMLAFSRQEFSNVPIRFWRNWPVGNNWVQPSEKGEIINLKGAGNQMLYIHHRYSLYTTKDRLTLEGDSTNVTLGSGDIFAVTPYEVVSVNEGHSGLKNRNWQSLSPFGYAWIQADHGKIYSHNGKEIDEISGKEMRIYFRDFIDGTIDRDEAFTLVNDDRRRRMLIGINQDRNIRNSGRILSYSISGNFWSFFQDGTLTFPIITRDKRVFYNAGFSSNAIETLVVAEGGYNNGIKPLIIEAVFSDGASAMKYLQYLKWNTNVYDSDNNDLQFETFNKLVIYSSTKIYGKVGGIDPLEWQENLEPYVGFPKGTQNVRRVEGEWFTNSFRDIWDGSTNILLDTVDNNGPNTAAVNEVLSWDKKGRMRDKYLIVRLYYDKNNTNRIEFESLHFGSKPSFR